MTVQTAVAVGIVDSTYVAVGVVSHLPMAGVGSCRSRLAVVGLAEAGLCIGPMLGKVRFELGRSRDRAWGLVC